MPTAILRPSAIGSHNGWGLTVGSSKPSACDPGDPLAHDDASSYLTSDVNRQTFTVQATGSPGVGSINSLLLKIRVLRDIDGESPADASAFVRVNGVDGVSQTVSCADTPAWRTYTAATNPLKSGSVALVGSDIKYSDTNFQMGGHNPGAAAIPLTSFWGELNYNPAGGGFAFLLCSALGMFHGLTLNDMPTMAHKLWTKSEILIHPHEYALALRELKDMSSVVYFT